MTQDLTIDQYSAYEYKPAFAENLVGHVKSWVPDEHKRRLQAYMLLSAYLENSARVYLPNDDDPDSRREYGDPALIVQTLVDAIVGEDTRVMVQGARAKKEPDEYADTLQDFFDKWVDDEKLLMTVMEAEEDATGLGDGVFEVAWDSTKGRATVTCYDPGFYFPVLDPSEAREQFPDKVHFAWEYEKYEGRTRNRQRFVRRITYELVDYGEGATFQFPWNKDPSTRTCLKSDGTWSYERLGSSNWLDLDESKATWAVNAEGEVVHNLDIGIDFIPVVHLPNTISRKEHFGRSVLQKVLQIIDDIQSTDTDLLKTSRTTGSPPLGSKGPVETNEEGKVTTYGPGQVISGEVTVIDTSRNLDALLKYITELLKRLSTNIRMPESVLGKLRPSEVPSGIALALSFGPLRSLVRRMRLARSEKYPLLLKFVHRFTMLDDAHSDLVPSREKIDTVPAIEMAFGQFLPSDRAVIITDIGTLFREKLISRATAIKLLIEETGMDIREASEEVDSIQAEDFEGAGLLSTALESPEAAAEYLGREIPAMSEARKKAIEVEAAAQPAPFGGGGGGDNPPGNGQRPRSQQGAET